MEPRIAKALTAFLTQPRTIRDVARRFGVSKVTAAQWLGLFPTTKGSIKQGKRGPWSQTFTLARSEPSK